MVIFFIFIHKLRIRRGKRKEEIKYKKEEQATRERKGHWIAVIIMGSFLVSLCSKHSLLKERLAHGIKQMNDKYSREFKVKLKQFTCSPLLAKAPYFAANEC